MIKQFLHFYCPALLIFLCLGSAATANVVEAEQFANETLRLRYLDLIEELRCPKCQNQNLADSNSAIAVDLRREVRRLLDEGKSDQEITDYLVARYGDFVRYRPPLKSTTWILWGAPGLLLLLGIIGVLMVRRQRRPQQNVQQNLNPQEQQQLDQLLLQSKVSSERDQKND